MNNQPFASDVALLGRIPLFNPNAFGNPYSGPSAYLGGVNRPYGQGGSRTNQSGSGGSGGYGGSGGSGGSASNPSGMELESTTQSPYGSGYSNPSADLAGGYPRGTADRTAATGNYSAEAARRSQIDRSALSTTEIRSGRSLNDLLRHVVALQKRGIEGPNVPLDKDTLQHLNLQVVGGRGNGGLRKGAGTLDWPAPLRDARFAEGRKRFADQMADAVEQVKWGNRVKPGRIEVMEAELARLAGTLRKSMAELSPPRYVEAMRYLRQLGHALETLEDGKASDRVSNARAPRVKNVAMLVRYLGDNGLEFAPAVNRGDPTAYRALYRALATFDAGFTAATK
jgi:hypothetical protein